LVARAPEGEEDLDDLLERGLAPQRGIARAELEAGLPRDARVEGRGVLLEHRQIAQRTIDREVDAVVDLLEVAVLLHRAQQARDLVDHPDREAPREHHRDTSSSLPDVAAGMGIVLGELVVRRVPANQTICPSERLTIMGFAYT